MASGTQFQPFVSIVFSHCFLTADKLTTYKKYCTFIGFDTTLFAHHKYEYIWIIWTLTIYNKKPIDGWCNNNEPRHIHCYSNDLFDIRRIYSSLQNQTKQDKNSKWTNKINQLLQLCGPTNAVCYILCMCYCSIVYRLKCDYFWCMLFVNRLLNYNQAGNTFGVERIQWVLNQYHFSIVNKSPHSTNEWICMQ